MLFFPPIVTYDMSSMTEELKELIKHIHFMPNEKYDFATQVQQRLSILNKLTFASSPVICSKEMHSFKQ